VSDSSVLAARPTAVIASDVGVIGVISLSQWPLCPFVICVSFAAQQLSVFSAERCLSEIADLLRLHAVPPHGDSVFADNVQRGPPFCEPSALPHQAHLRLLLYTSSPAQILLRLDNR